MRFAVLYGSVRRNRKGIRAARFVVQCLERRGHDVTLLDAAEQDLPFLDLMHKEYDPGTAPAAMQRVHAVLDAADAIVVVSGEYNHSVPPALKNMLDTFQSEYHYKPAGIVTYSAGPFGGVRVAPHMRAILGELGMASISIMFAVSRLGESLDENGNDVTGDRRYERRAGRFLRELEWYADALRRKRQADGTPDQPVGDRQLEEAEGRAGRHRGGTDQEVDAAVEVPK